MNTNGLEIKTNNQEIVIIFWVTCENKSWKTWEVNLKSIIMCWFNYPFVLSLWSFFLYWMLPASNILLLMLFHDNLYAFFVLFMCWMRSFLYIQKIGLTQSNIRLYHLHLNHVFFICWWYKSIFIDWIHLSISYCK